MTALAHIEVIRTQRIGLTLRMDRCLDFIRAYRAAHRVCPSYVEIAAGVRLASKSGVYRMMQALEERGHIRIHRDHNGKSYARGYEVVDDDAAITRCPHCGNALGSQACAIAARSGINNPKAEVQHRTF